MNKELSKQSTLLQVLTAPVIVAALGAFVDIYDILLFNIVRIPSLRSLGLSETEVSTQGASIMNWQMIGLLLGGFLFGSWGDKKGRISVLFGSIITYSIAQIASGLVHDVSHYKFFRFWAGIGLSGEMGAGITLVAEILPKKLRAFGTTFIGGIGMLGAVAAYLTTSLFQWRIAYFIGGGMGILLLLSRIGILESGLFDNIKKNKTLQKGNFFYILRNKDKLILYLKCIGIGVTSWFFITVPIAFSNEFGKVLHIEGTIDPGTSIFWLYIGISISSLFSGFLAYYLKSRKKTILYLLILGLISYGLFLFSGIRQPLLFYSIIFLMGIHNGYWGLFITIAAEQFGTNIRSTVATTVPNIVRGLAAAWTSLYFLLKDHFSIIASGLIVGLVCFAIGFYSILTIPETHNKDLNFVE